MTGQTSRAEPLLAAIAAWLSENFKLPATKTLTAELRYQDNASNDEPGGHPTVSGEEPGDIVALYDPLRRSIDLAEGWHGDTPTEVSILVHEMVHFLQDIARQEFECPQARERMVYAAQERWLEMSGYSLAKDFDVDDFTLLVRSNCLH